MESYRPTRLLITVMTYPHPSVNYRETVCTAGITDSGEWIRLYPLSYRYSPPDRRFRKYQWIEVELAARGSRNDDRKESRKANVNSIRLLGPPLGTYDGWRERRRVVDLVPARTVGELMSLYETERVSLGVVRPKRVIDLTVEEDTPVWPAKQQGVLDQLTFFERPKDLAKIPFKFSYVFECADDSKPRSASITDWELGVLYLKELDRTGSHREAAASVRAKFLKMCAPERDTRFFMGTTWPYNAWIVLGVFWPPRQSQMDLDL